MAYIVSKQSGLEWLSANQPRRRRERGMWRFLHSNGNVNVTSAEFSVNCYQRWCWISSCRSVAAFQINSNNNNNTKAAATVFLCVFLSIAQILYCGHRVLLISGRFIRVPSRSRARIGHCVNRTRPDRALVGGICRPLIIISTTDTRRLKRRYFSSE